MGRYFRRKLTGEDICNIVEAGGRAGVGKIVLQDLVISYGSVDNEVVALPPVQVVEQEVEHVISKELAKEMHEERLNELMISDPEEWERQVTEGQ